MFRPFSLPFLAYPFRYFLQVVKISVFSIRESPEFFGSSIVNMLQHHLGPYFVSFSEIEIFSIYFVFV